MADKKKVVITGSGGKIGSVLRGALGDKYEFSGIDRVSSSDPNFESLTAELTNFNGILPAFEGKDTVVHLAAERRQTPRQREGLRATPST